MASFFSLHYIYVKISYNSKVCHGKDQKLWNIYKLQNIKFLSIYKGDLKVMVYHGGNHKPYSKYKLHSKIVRHVLPLT